MVDFGLESSSLQFRYGSSIPSVNEFLGGRGRWGDFFLGCDVLEEGEGVLGGVSKSGGVLLTVLIKEDQDSVDVYLKKDHRDDRGAGEAKGRLVGEGKT